MLRHTEHFRMNRRSALVFLSVALALLLFAPDRARACTCIRVGIEENLRYADVVFTGEVVRIGWPWWSPTGWRVGDRWQMAVARVDTLYKGDVGRLAEFTYWIGEEMCGLSLREGRRGVFILAADVSGLTTNLCIFDLQMDVQSVVDVLGDGRTP